MSEFPHAPGRHRENSLLRSPSRRSRRTSALVIALASAGTSLGVPTAAHAGTPTTQFLWDSMGQLQATGWGDRSVFDQAGASAVSASTATLDLPPGVSREALIQDANVLDSSSIVHFSFRNLPTIGNGTWFAVATRKVRGFEYQQRVRLSPQGELRLTTVRIDGTADRIARISDTVVLPFTIKAGEQLYLRAQVQGASAVTLASRVWRSVDTEPAWQLVSTDTSAGQLTDKGSYGLFGYTSTTSESNAVDVFGVRASDLTPVVAPQAPAPSPSTTAPAPSPTTTAPAPRPSTPAPAPAPAPIGGGRPVAGNTGVPDGTRLTPYWGDLVITKAGAVYDALDVHGFVRVQAPNVTIRRSLIRGGTATTSAGLVTNVNGGATGFVIEDSTLRPDVPSVFLDGLKGGNYTARRLDISGIVDGAKVHGDNVSLTSSWIHDSTRFAHDPYQNNSGSHNDGVQVLGGRNITIRGNDISGAGNAAIQVTQDYSDVASLTVAGNWLGGGGCTVNVSAKGGGSMPALKLTSNLFNRISEFNCPMIIDYATSFEASNNVFLDGTPIRILRN